jgi:hypothetical protein
VPWSNFWKNPVYVEVRGVTLVLNFQQMSEWTKAFGHFTSNEQIMATFAAELTNKLQEKFGGSKDNTVGYMGAMFDNLRISVKDIHIRFEQGLDDGQELPSALGASLESLELLTVDLQGNETKFYTRGSTSEMIQKKLSLENLRFYHQGNL